MVSHNADSHGIVPDGFEMKIAGYAQFPCTVLLAVCVAWQLSQFA